MDSILVINGDSIHDAGTLIIDNTEGGKVEPHGTERVAALSLSGVQQTAGTYGATGSGAGTIDDVHFTGSAGMVEVVTPPALGTILTIR